jgi:hypothetical protein
MRRASITAAASALLIAGTFAVSHPAHAETIRQYRLTNIVLCIDSNGAGTRTPYTRECSNRINNQKWRVQPISTNETNLELVFLRNVGSNYCLDSHGSGEQDARMVSCNGGNYQAWEVHRNGNARIFKSWGAWKNDRKHTCLRADWITAETKLRMEGCDVSATSMKFIPYL